MRPSFARLGGGDTPLGKHDHYLGTWGNLGSRPQKGIITYGLSANRQNPFAGAAHDAIFNTWRRVRAQMWFVVPPFIAGYAILEWAHKRNEYLNSKAGIAEFSDEE